MPDHDPIDDLTRALAVTEDLLPGADGRWSDPTPCDGWSVLQLVEHLVGGHQLFADAATGAPPPAPFDPTGVLGDDARSALQGVGRALVEAFSRPGALEEPVTIPIGTVPGAVAVRVRIVESLVHGWDLARATGQTAAVPDDLAESTFAFTRGLLPNVPRDRSPFGPPQAVGDDAAPLVRLVALLGRDAR